MTVAYYFSELFVFLIDCHGHLILVNYFNPLQLQNSWRIDKKLFENVFKKKVQWFIYSNKCHSLKMFV